MPKICRLLPIGVLLSLSGHIACGSLSISKPPEVPAALARDNENGRFSDHFSKDELARFFNFGIEDSIAETAEPSESPASSWKYVVTGYGDLGPKARNHSPYGPYALRKNNRLGLISPGREHKSWRYFPVSQDIFRFKNHEIEASNRQKMAKYINNDEVLKYYSVFISESGLTEFLPRLLNIFFFYRILIEQSKTISDEEKILVQWWRNFTKILEGKLGETPEAKRDVIQATMKAHLYKSIKRVKKYYFPKLGSKKLNEMVNNLVNIEQEENISLIKHFKSALIKKTLQRSGRYHSGKLQI